MPEGFRCEREAVMVQEWAPHLMGGLPGLVSIPAMDGDGWATHTGWQPPSLCPCDPFLPLHSCSVTEDSQAKEPNF